MEQLAIDVVTKFTADVSGLTQGASQAAGAYNQVAGAQDKVGSSASQATAGVKLLGTAFKGLIALGVVKWLTGAADSYEQAERANIKLNDTLAKNETMLAKGADYWDNYASSIEDYTRYSDEAVKTTVALLGNFGLTADQVETMTPLVADLAEKMGLSLESATRKVTMALSGSTRGLQMMGIQMEGVRKGANNTQAVMDGLSRSVGGFAKKAQDLYSVQLAHLQNEFDNFKENVGQAVTPVLAALVRFGLTPIAEALQRIPQPLLAVGAGLAVVVSAGKALQPVFGVIASSFKTVFSGALQLGKTGFAALGMGAGEAAAATDELGTSMEDTTSTFSNANTSIQSVIARQQQLMMATSGSISANQAMTISLAEAAAAGNAEAVATIERVTAERAAIISAGGVVSAERAKQLALEGVTLELTRAAEARVALTAAETSGGAAAAGSAFAKVAGFLGKLGVVAAVATVAVAGLSAAWGWYKDRQEKAAAALDEFRVKAIATGSAIDNATYIVRKYSDVFSDVSGLQKYDSALGETSGLFGELQNQLRDAAVAAGKFKLPDTTSLPYDLAQRIQELKSAREELLASGYRGMSGKVDTSDLDAQIAAAEAAKAEYEQVRSAGAAYRSEQEAINAEMRAAEKAARGMMKGLSLTKGSYRDLAREVSTTGQAFGELTGYDIEGKFSDVNQLLGDQKMAVLDLRTAWSTYGEDIKPPFEAFISAAQAGGDALSEFKKGLTTGGEKAFMAFAEAAVTATGAAADGIQAMREELKAAEAEWRGEFADSINTTGDLLVATMENGTTSIEEMIAAAKKGAAGVRQWGNDFRELDKRFGGMKGFDQFQQWVVSLGADGIPYMEAALEGSNKQAKTLFETMGNGAKTAADVALTVQRKIGATLTDLMAILKEMAKGLEIELPSAADKGSGAVEEGMGKAATAAQVADGKVKGLATSIERLPDGKVIIHADTSPATSEMAQWLARANNLDVYIGVHTRGVGFHTGGEVFHAGGAVGARKMGAQEIPAILQRGEFVIQRRAVQKFGRHLFEMLNQGVSGVYSPSEMRAGSRGASGSDIHMDIEVNPVIDREQFIKGVTYSTKVTGR